MIFLSWIKDNLIRSKKTMVSLTIHVLNKEMDSCTTWLREPFLVQMNDWVTI